MARTYAERAYIEGRRSAWNELLRQAIGEVGLAGGTVERWQLERAELVASLRSLCAEFGDNDWPDDLNLRDVLEKHLGDHLRR